MRADATDTPAVNDRGHQQSYVYDAFLSYDHDDRAAAYGIQRGLHRIGRRVGRLHALRVFRDSTDLTASPDLWGKVTEAMDRSRYMIAVLSPNAVASKWVNKEVAHWLQQRGPDRLLFVVAGGNLAWDETAGRFDPDRSNAALPVLTQPGVLTAEPLYVDVSDDAPWDPTAPLFREKLTDLAAPIHGKPKYELASEDLREQRRFRRLRRAAIISLVVLTVLALVAAGIAVVKQLEANRERQEAVHQRQEAVHQRNEAEARRLVAEAQSIMVGGRPGSELEVIDKLLAAQHISRTPDLGVLLTALRRWAPLQKVFDTPNGGHLSADGQRIAIETESGVVIRETGTGEAIGHPLEDSRYHHLTGMSADGRYLAIVGDSNEYRVWDSAMGQFIGQPMTGSVCPLRSAVSLDGRRLAAADGDTVRIWDSETGQQIGSPQSGHGVVADVKFSPDGRRVASSGLDNTVRLWDASNGAAVGAPLRGDPKGPRCFHVDCRFQPRRPQHRRRRQHRGPRCTVERHGATPTVECRHRGGDRNTGLRKLRQYRFGGIQPGREPHHHWWPRQNGATVGRAHRSTDR